MLELPEGTKPSDAVVWLQKAFTLADPLEDDTVPGVAELKVCVFLSNLPTLINLSMNLQISILQALGLLSPRSSA